MSKKAIINPRWLDVMLTAWGIDALNRMSGGYPGECPMFKERLTGQQPAMTLRGTPLKTSATLRRLSTALT